MPQLLRLLVLVFLAWLVVHLVRRAMARLSGGAGGPATARTDRAKLPVDFVRCAHCGVHLPKNEAVRSDDRYYCNQAHLAAGGRG